MVWVKCWSLLLGTQGVCRMPCLSPTGPSSRRPQWERASRCGCEVAWTLNRCPRARVGSCSTCLAPALLQACSLPQHSLCCVARPSRSISMWVNYSFFPQFSFQFLEHMSKLKHSSRASTSPFAFVLTLCTDARIYPVYLFYFIDICAFFQI